MVDVFDDDQPLPPGGRAVNANAPAAGAAQRAQSQAALRGARDTGAGNAGDQTLTPAQSGTEALAQGPDPAPRTRPDAGPGLGPRT